MQPGRARARAHDQALPMRATSTGARLTARLLSRSPPACRRPEALVERILEALGARYDVAIDTLTTAQESMAFPLPRTLRELAERGCGKNGPFR